LPAGITANIALRREGYFCTLEGEKAKIALHMDAKIALLKGAKFARDSLTTIKLPITTFKLIYNNQLMIIQISKILISIQD